MSLRFLLVGLVAILGFELPSGQEFKSWTQGGTQWVKARGADLSSLWDGAERAFAGGSESERIAEVTSTDTVEVASLRDDLTFDAVVEGMASNFVADLTSIEVAKPVEKALAVVAPSEETSEPTCLDPEAEVLEINVFAEESPQTFPAVSTVEVSSKVDKLSAAVRLTREAMNAWASLIQTSTERVADPDQDDTF